MFFILPANDLGDHEENGHRDGDQTNDNGVVAKKFLVLFLAHRWSPLCAEWLVWRDPDPRPGAEYNGCPPVRKWVGIVLGLKNL